VKAVSALAAGDSTALGEHFPKVELVGLRPILVVPAATAAATPFGW